MLNGPASAPKGPSVAAAGQGIRLCSICDGIEAVMLFAAWFARLPSVAKRVDLSMAEALDYLSHHRDERFDQVALVPNPASSAAPRLLEALIYEATARSQEVLLLLPQKARLRLAPEVLARVRVLRGPPFAPEQHGTGDDLADLTEGEVLLASDPSPRGILQRLTGRKTPERGIAAPKPKPPPGLRPGLRTIMVFPSAGGIGGTAFAVNLAAELAVMQSHNQVCLVDLNLQFGNVATYTGLSVSSRVVDAYRSIGMIDSDVFGMCLQNCGPNLQVFSGPGEILPSDGITAPQLQRILALARERADLVVVDLPHHILDWSEAAFAEADVIFALCGLDVRSAQNMARLRALMRQEGLPEDKLLFLLNRVPAKRAPIWKSACEEFEKANEAPFFALLPEGGEEVVLACNAGLSLSKHAPGNALRKSIRELAQKLHEKALERPETAVEPL